MIKTLGPNTVGRDFVIGDLHGAFSLFEQLLEKINFDPTTDRMLSVGDLVDRGPDSLKCLQLLTQPWFHSVLSNHEQMMLSAFDGSPGGEYWLLNGGSWGLTQLVAVGNGHLNMLTDSERQLIDLIPLVRELPWLMTVNHSSGKKFHIIHAELPPGCKPTDADLADEAKVKELATVQSRDGDFLLWGRFLYSAFYAADLSNMEKIKRTISYGGGATIFNDQLSHIISGHTILQRPLTIAGQTNIDTGAYAALDRRPDSWCALTCLELDTWTFHQQTTTEYRQVVPAEINGQDISSK